MAIFLFIVLALVSFAVQANLNAKFKRYSKVRLASGMTGREVAEKMLRDNGITDVKVTCTPGYLTDHYDPARGTVNLSEGVYHSNSVAAAAVAAHECGHAVQHATAYGPLTLRSALVPPVQFASNWMQWVLLAGILLIEVYPAVFLFGILLFALTTLFSFVTLPVELDASNRATQWLSQAGITSAQDHPMAVSALRAAASTYVVAALGSLATLVYYVLMFLGNSRDD